MPRTAFLSRGGRVVLGLSGGWALLGTGQAIAAAPPDDDLAHLRLGLAGELLTTDFYGRALATRRLGTVARDLRQARSDERAHADALSRSLVAAGQTPLGEGDVDFTYPDRSFSSDGSLAKLGLRLELLLLGIYLGAAAAVQTDSLRLLTAQIAASESQHVSLFSVLTGRGRIGRAFPRPLTIDEASSALDAFES